jgi:AcrR family transcriptional regulator
MPVIAELGETATRAKLLQGTARVIARKGVAATTVQDILTASGLSRRTFYQNFGSKDDALYALFALVTDTMLQTIRAAATATDPVERMLQTVDAYLPLWRANAKLSFVLQTEAMRAGSPLGPLRQRTIDALCADAASAHERATGEAVDPLFFRAMILSLEGLLSHAAEDPAATHERIRHVLEPLVRRLLAPEGAPLPSGPEAPSPA